MTGAHRFLLRWKLPVLAGPWSIPADPRDFPVFLLMGQSNMAGFGCIRATDPWHPGDLAPVGGVLALGGQGTVGSARPRGWIRWRPASHPLHLNQRSAGFGLGLPFATCLLEESRFRRVGLIPGAWSGAGIDQLDAGTPLYNNAVRRARIAARHGTLAGVLWHQGETDAGTDELARSHSGKLAALVRQLRADLAEPELPFVIGDLASPPNDDGTRGDDALRSLVRRGLRHVADHDSRAAFVESCGLARIDGVHFGRESLVEFGRRYAVTFLRTF